MTENTRTKIAAGSALLLVVLAGIGVARAGEGRSKADGEERRGPPPAAFEACKGKKADEACEVSFGAHKRAGKCGTPRRAAAAGALVCRPERKGPPPAVFEACTGKKAGDVCSVQLGEKTRQGKCQTGRSDKLVCRP